MFNKKPKLENGRIPLTKRQREIYAVIKDTPGCRIYKHYRPTGSPCYRLRSSGGSPIMNIQSGIISEMVNKFYLERTDEGYYIPLTAEDYAKKSKEGLYTKVLS